MHHSSRFELRAYVEEPTMVQRGDYLCSARTTRVLKAPIPKETAATLANCVKSRSLVAVVTDVMIKPTARAVLYELRCNDTFLTSWLPSEPYNNLCELEMPDKDKSLLGLEGFTNEEPVPTELLGFPELTSPETEEITLSPRNQAFGYHTWNISGVSFTWKGDPGVTAGTATYTIGALPFCWPLDSFTQAHSVYTFLVRVHEAGAKQARLKAAALLTQTVEELKAC